MKPVVDKKAKTKIVLKENIKPIINMPSKAGRKRKLNELTISKIDAKP